MQSIDPAATAWLLASTALVLLMTPGLAIFYGGMVRTTGVLNMIMMSFIAIPLVTVAWLLVGYTLAFSGSGAVGLIGDLAHLGMAGIAPDTPHGAVPELLFATFQLSFAIITAALVSGAIADRAKFAAWMVFVPLWAIAVYAVVAHWVWAPGGWLFKLGVLDYAGGLVVEIVSGAVGPGPCPGARPAHRLQEGRDAPAQSAVRASRRRLAVVRLVRVQRRVRVGRQRDGRGDLLEHARRRLPGHAGLVSVEQIRDGRPTTFGAASGVVAGLVAITPSCGTVNTLGAAIVGLAAGIVCSFAIGLKFRFGYDDSLDVVGVHFVGGVVGVLLIGLLATAVMTGGPQGLFYRRRIRAAGQAGPCGGGGRRVRVLGVVRAGEDDRPHHGLPGERRGRDDRCGFHPACRDRVCRGRARAPAVAPAGLVRGARRDAATRDGRRRLAGSQ